MMDELILQTNEICIPDILYSKNNLLDSPLFKLPIWSYI